MNTLLTGLLTLLLIASSVTTYAESDAPVAVPAVSTASEPLVIRYHHVLVDNVYNNLSDYIYAVLDLAMRKSRRAYRIEAIKKQAVPIYRNMKYLKSGRFDVAWMHTNREREQGLHPIRVPLYRGLTGWRVAFVREDEQRFAALDSLEELQALVAGQGEMWPDTKILKSNHFAIRPAHARDNLFEMLRLKRIDYFPRGVFEVAFELDEAHAHNLKLDRHIALQYPTAFYLFTRQDDRELFEALESGFTRAINDGSYLWLFYEFFGEAIDHAALQQRQIFRLSNDHLPAETPLDQNALWFEPGEKRPLR